MSPLDAIWKHLHDRSTWPPVPEKPLVAATAAMLRPASVEDLVAVTPTDDLPQVKRGAQKVRRG